MLDKGTALLLVIGMVVAGCSSGDESASSVAEATPPPVAIPPPAQNPAPPLTPASTLDLALRSLIAEHNLSGDPSSGRELPQIGDPLAQLGKKLFFSKSLGGEFDSACVSCHHPMLGGSDGLSLSIGTGALDPDHLGPGRTNATGIPNVPRNAPTTFNTAIWDTGLFMDSRVESLGKEIRQNGAASGISTPDSGFNIIDSMAGRNLATAQAKFPVTSSVEMRGALLAGESNAALRAHLASRLGNFGSGAGEISASGWLAEFQSAFASAESAETLITFDNIALALAEYERTQVFVDSPWRSYVLGDNNAINADAKQGAVLFLSDDNEGGADCVQCHSGDMFSDGEHHVVGTPQFGPGKNDIDRSDFGREVFSGNAFERFRFRTPSLLNVEVTAPYMHTGAYESLQQVLAHYDNPGREVDEFFDEGGWCQLDQFAAVQNCRTLYPEARANTEQVLNKINQERNQDDPAALPNINLNNTERRQIIEFLLTLTDPCVLDRACMQPWIPSASEAPDANQLNALGTAGILL